MNSFRLISRKNPRIISFFLRKIYYKFFRSRRIGINVNTRKKFAFIVLFCRKVTLEDFFEENKDGYLITYRLLRIYTSF